MVSSDASAAMLCLVVMMVLPVGLVAVVGGERGLAAGVGALLAVGLA